MATPTALELSRQLVELEGHAKSIRNEVEHLRATKRSLDVADVTANKMVEIRESTGGSTTASKSRRSRASTQRSSAAKSLPQDFIDDLNRACGAVDTSIRAHKELAREKAALEDALAFADASAEAAEQDYDEVAQVAGADADGKSRSAAGTRKKNAYDAALRETVILYQQRENVRRQLEGQSRELLRLASILQETTDAMGQRTEATEVLAERKAKLVELRKERDQVARGIARKDKIADKNQTGPTEEDYIRHSNFDRKVALHELTKEDSLIKANDLAIRHRAMQIAKLQMRLELIGDAVVGGSANAEEDRVDVEAVDALAKEIEELHESHLVSNIRMENIDCEIEKMEWRAGALQHAKESALVEMERVSKEHRRYLRELQQTLDKERISTGQNIVHLQQDIDTIHRKSARRPQPAPPAVKSPQQAVSPSDASSAGHT